MAHVLIVDNEPIVVAVLSSALADEGYSVAAAHDGHAALALLEDGLRPSLILTDHMMPGLTGAELAAAIRERYPQEAPSVVVMSANHRALEAIDGVAAKVPKPFELSEIVNILERYCQRSV